MSRLSTPRVRAMPAESPFRTADPYFRAARASAHRRARRRAGRVGAAFVLLLALFVDRAPAQITAAMLSGTAKDETGAVLPGVDVEIKNVNTGLSRAIV